MTTKNKTLPDKSLIALKEAIEHMPRSSGNLVKLFKDVLDHPDQHYPHPVYIIDPEDIASAEDFRHAPRIAGWRYLTKSDGDRNLAIEVQHDPDDSNHRFAELDKGPFIDGMYQALEDKRFTDKIEHGDLKPSVLRISQMGIFVVWLRADDSGNDVIIPISPTPSYLKYWPETYSANQFQDALRDEAKSELESAEFDA